MDNIHYIPSINNFPIEYSNKTLDEQLKQLKLFVDNSINYFQSTFINISDINNNDDILNNFNNKYKIVIDEGYDYLLKIQTMLEIIIINDISQSNCIKYEECLKNIFNPTNFLNFFNDLFSNVYSNQIDYLINESKIYHNYSTKDIMDILKFIEKIEFIQHNKEKNELNEKINVFNHYINKLVITNCKIKLIIKDIYIRDY